MRNRAQRRHEAVSHQMRRIKEDRNQHYSDLKCACWHNPKVIARFREQPKLCSCWMCGNPRRYEKGKARLTRQELRESEPARALAPA